MDMSIQERFLGKEEIQKLQSKTVALIGLGGIGSTVAEVLVRNGVNLRIVDKDRVYEKDQPRQTLFTREDVTKFKAKQGKKRLEEINKNVKVKTFHEELTKDNLFLLEADLIIDASNSKEITLMVNEFAVRKKIPLIVANYSGSKGHIFTVDKVQHKKSACANCITAKLALPPISKEGAYPPTAINIAGFVISAAIKNLVGIKNIETLVYVDMLKMEVRRRTVEKEKGCPHCKLAK